MLSIVTALAPAVTMVQVVVLNGNLGLEHAQNREERRRCRGVYAEATVAPYLEIRHVLLANVPLVEAHGDPKHHERQVGQQRHNYHLDHLLLVVGVRGQQWVRVLGEVVGAVILP